MNRVKYLKQDIWPAKIGITDNYDVFQRALKRYKSEYEAAPDGDCYGQTVDGMHNGGFYVLLYFNLEDSGPMEKLVDTIAHECTHAWQMICRHLDEDARQGDEAEAYMIGWLTRNVIKILCPKIAAMRPE